MDLVIGNWRKKSAKRVLTDMRGAVLSSAVSPHSAFWAGWFHSESRPDSATCRADMSDHTPGKGDIELSIERFIEWKARNLKL